MRPVGPTVDSSVAGGAGMLASGAVPGMDPAMMKLFKQALAEQKGHGLKMGGPKRGNMTMHLHDI